MRTLAHALLVGAFVGSCGSDDKYALGGEVTGLVSTGLILTNNALDDLTINANGPFVFGAPLRTHEVFLVSVKVQPLGETCSVTNGAGAVEHSSITDVLVACGPVEASTPKSK